MAEEKDDASLESSSDDEQGGISSLSGFSLRRPTNPDIDPAPAMKSALPHASFSRELTSLDVVVRACFVLKVLDVWNMAVVGKDVVLKMV